MFWRFGLACLCLFGLVPVASAASLYIDPAQNTMNRGDAKTFSVRLDAGDVDQGCVNAVDVVISYDDNIIPTDVSVGRSIVSLWVEPPTINKDARTITFAGGIPNGYCGRVAGDPRLTNILADIVFRSPGLRVGGTNDSNIAQVSLQPESAVYLNDGLGTRISPALYGTTITLEPNVGSVIIDTWRDTVAEDTISPEPFEIILDTANPICGGKHCIIFNTTDKQSGLSHYEVIEERSESNSYFQFGAANAPWERATSPHILRDQSLTSIIRVKAIDKAGNEYMATILPADTGRTLGLPVLLLAGAGLTVLLLAGLYVVLRRRRAVIAVEADSPNQPII